MGGQGRAGRDLSRGGPRLALVTGCALVAAAAWWLTSPDDGAPATERPSAEPSAADHPGPDEAKSRAEAGADQRAAPSAAGRSQKKIVFEVTGPEGAPVPGASVAVVRLGGPAEVGLTSPEGVVELPAGYPAPVKVRAEGYVDQTFAPPAFGEAPEVFWSVRLAVDEGSALRGAVHAGGRPVKGAVVVLPSDPVHEAQLVKTGPEGRFSFPEVSATGRELIALHAAYGEGRAERPASSTEVIIELPEPAFVEGVVVDEGGAPLEEATVRLTPRSARASEEIAALREALVGKRSRRGHARWLSRALGKVETELDGRAGHFRAGPAAAGTLDVVGYAPGFEPAVVEGLEIRAGSTLSGVRLVLQGPARVTGRVTDSETGEPIRGARLSTSGFAGRRVPGFAEARTGRDGTFALTIPADKRQRLRVRARGYLPFSVGGLEADRGEHLERDIRLTRAEGAGRHTREYVGIGATVKKVDDGVKVLQTLKGGAAFDQLQKDDVIVRVGSTWVDDMELQDAIELLVGEAGSEVDVLVHRRGPDGELQELDVALNRRRLQYSLN